LQGALDSSRESSARLKSGRKTCDCENIAILVNSCKLVATSALISDGLILRVSGPCDKHCLLDHK
jgi:hypothetical protein